MGLQRDRKCLVDGKRPEQHAVHRGFGRIEDRDADYLKEKIPVFTRFNPGPVRGIAIERELARPSGLPDE